MRREQVAIIIGKNPDFAEKTLLVFDRLDNGALKAATSAVTLSECLVLPYRLSRPETAQTFITMLVDNTAIAFIEIDAQIANQAATLSLFYPQSAMNPAKGIALSHEICYIISTYLQQAPR
jgi:hypothetical protein